MKVEEELVEKMKIEENLEVEDGEWKVKKMHVLDDVKELEPAENRDIIGINRYDQNS